MNDFFDYIANSCVPTTTNIKANAKQGVDKRKTLIVEVPRIHLVECSFECTRKIWTKLDTKKYVSEFTQKHRPHEVNRMIPSLRRTKLYITAISVPIQRPGLDNNCSKIDK